MEEAPAFAADLIAWYDAEARSLPWRAPPGSPPPDPYRVWLSEVMLQQTTVAAVAPRFERFLMRWPTIDALAAAPEAEVLQEWAGLGYYARARNLHGCARAVSAAGGFPRSEAALRALPGVGDYTAAAVAAIAHGVRVTPVDANIARVTARVFATDAPRAALRSLIEPLAPADRPGDFAQALMDLGSRICTPGRPGCDRCPVHRHCMARARGLVDRFPARKAKMQRPVRRGTAFWLERDGHVHLVRRPPNGLLGGMLALPSSDWTEQPATLSGAPAPADWRLLETEVRHLFTHFALRLSVAVARAGPDAPGGAWVPIHAIDQAGLPTVFRKAAAAARTARP